jgi:hypothetical protein
MPSQQAPPAAELTFTSGGWVASTMKSDCVSLASLRRDSGHAWGDQYSNPKSIPGANTKIAPIEVKDASGKSRKIESSENWSAWRISEGVSAPRQGREAELAKPDVRW